MISIKGLDKAEVLAALYNRSKPQGMGYLAYNPTPMTREEADILIKTSGTYFDYLLGRVMKVDLSGDDLDGGMYDRDLGRGAAEEVINEIRARVAS